jgi:uncharacterized repeat protein (TIGR03803 family)
MVRVKHGHASHLPSVSTVVMALVLGAALYPANLAHAQTYTVLHNFTGGADGYYPEAGLTLQGTANLFGGGGSNTAFRLRRGGTGWVFNPIFEFTDNEGGPLSGRVTFGPGGALYGSSSFGGQPGCADGAGCGFIFSMRPPSTFCRTVSCPWTESVLYEFNPQGRRGDGQAPLGGLIFDASGNMYGTTYSAGLFGGGTVFELTPSQGGWSEIVLYSFPGGAAGANPNGNLILDSSGNLIGTTETGGTNNCLGPQCGVVFELTHTSSGWVETVLHNFNYSSDGGYPFGGLISDAAGNLYGTTMIGGPNVGGTVYELTPSNGSYTFRLLHSFTGEAGQFGPIGILALDSGGNLYGATNQEGAFNSGNVFKLTFSGGNWVYSDLHDFGGGADGTAPYDGPAVDAGGNLYGTALEGGTGTACPGGCGVVWEIAP